MAEDQGRKSNWVRDLLVLPLIVASIVAAVAFGLPIFFRDVHELSYRVDGPVAYLSDPAIGKVSVQIDGVPVSDLIAYKVRLWNSGDVPLKTIPVSLVFERVQNGFQLFTTYHSTTPSHEFGEIKQDQMPIEDSINSDRHDKVIRFVYQLLNPGDEDIITLLTNYRTNLNVFAKAEDVTVRAVEPPADWRDWIFNLFPVVAGVMGAMASLLTGVLSRLQTALLRRRDDHQPRSSSET